MKERDQRSRYFHPAHNQSQSRLPGASVTINLKTKLTASKARDSQDELESGEEKDVKSKGQNQRMDELGFHPRRKIGS